MKLPETETEDLILGKSGLFFYNFIKKTGGGGLEPACVCQNCQKTNREQMTNIQAKLYRYFP